MIDVTGQKVCKTNWPSLSSGNTQTIFPQIALGSGVPIDINGPPMSLSGYFSTFAQNFANNHGQGINNLVYEGY